VDRLQPPAATVRDLIVTHDTQLSRKTSRNLQWMIRPLPVKTLVNARDSPEPTAQASVRDSTTTLVLRPADSADGLVGNPRPASAGVWTSGHPGHEVRSRADISQNVKIGLQSCLRLIRTGGLHAIAVVRASPTTINFMLVLSLFNQPARAPSLD
jgi:hypothetical protein